MKKTFSTNHPLKIAFLFIVFFAVPILLSLLPINYLIRNWLIAGLLFFFTILLYKKEGKNISELGLNTRFKNFRFLPIGILVGILFFCFLFLLQKLQNGIKVSFNQKANYILILGRWLVALPAVLMEELIFRGYCFKKTIDIAGITKANIIFATLFIIWHWIALSAWGNFGQMLALITTGFGHLLFAIALIKSNTLFFPIGNGEKIGNKIY